MSTSTAPHIHSSARAHLTLQEALELAERVALEAGATLREACMQQAQSSDMGLSPVGLSPVEQGGEVHALADLRAERLIRAQLTAASPSWGFRAEEEPELNQAPQDEAESFWLVDPNDGTSAFLKGERGASVSIALIQRGRPVLGVIYAYLGLDQRGDLISWAEGCGPVRRDGSPSTGAWRELWEESVIFVSNSADQIARAYQDALAEARFRVAPGVAYRLALVAVGEGEVAVSLAGPRDFDYAAGHALLRGAGGALVDERGVEVSYHPTAPVKLGFAFGGAPPHLKRLVTTDWRAVLSREGCTKVPHHPPSALELCAHVALHQRALGAWWGWHFSVALNERSELAEQLTRALETGEPLNVELERELEREMKRRGPAPALTLALRAELSSSPQLPSHIDAHPAYINSALWKAFWSLVFLGELIPETLETPSETPNETSDRTSDERLPLLAQRCAERGARALPPRLIGALLCARHGDPLVWGSDSARLLEAALTKRALSRP